jgi:hypothetical protein
VRQLLRREWQFLAIVALILLFSLPILTYPLGRDQGEFATVGRGLLNGRIPYIDLWNPKPPAVFYVYAAAMATFGQTTSALRAIDLIIAPFILAAIYWLGTRVHSRHAGLWAVLLFGVFYFTETFWTLTQNDGIVLLPMTLAMVCIFKAADGGRRSWLWAFAAGLLCGWTFWFKYPFVLFVGATGLSYLFVRWNATSHRIIWRDVAAFVVGLLAVVLGGVGVMMALGAWDALVESARVTSQYTAISLNWTDFSDALRVTMGYRWAHWGLLLVLAGVGLILLATPHPLTSSPTQAGRGGKVSLGNIPVNGKVLLLWLDAGLVIMLAQAKIYDYHWLPILPPLVLLGGIGIERAFEKVLEPQRRNGSEGKGDGMFLNTPTFPRFSSWRTWRPGGSIIIAALLLAILVNGVWSRALPYLTGQEDQIAYYHHFQGGEFVADESQLMADFLRARVMPGDSLYIWGFRPEVYYLSRLNPPTRFIFQFPLVADWYPEEWQEENVEILWAALPPYVLVLQVDYMPWVTGSHEDSNSLLQDYHELNDWLIYNYERETMIGNFIVWRRKS